jgi:CarD family transcriptional regulator
MWSRRAQEYEQKINSGKLYDLAEVVRDLNKKTDVIAEQSYSERQLFEKAYDRLKSEFEIILGEKAKDKMDKALKREVHLVQEKIA